MRAPDAHTDAPDAAPDGAPCLRFRGPTYEQAVANAHQALGVRPRVLAANRIRRGGIGGFFATDLGVEVSVVPDDESGDGPEDAVAPRADAVLAALPTVGLEDTLARLVDESGSADRRAWLAQLAAAASLEPPLPDLDDESEATPRSTSTDAMTAAEVDDEFVALLDDAAAELLPRVTPPPAPAAAPPAPAAAQPAPTRRARSASSTATARPTKHHLDLAVTTATEMAIRDKTGRSVRVEITLTDADGRAISAVAAIERGGDRLGGAS